MKVENQKVLARHFQTLFRIFEYEIKCRLLAIRAITIIQDQRLAIFCANHDRIVRNIFAKKVYLTVAQLAELP
ncbi:hypothetical protein [Halomicronema sp. CCY15110]|uniref:hypothetical protein n=1 Tax=Halomicronema sp. CCY15110 TaxID=2767773 RepID=UPI0019512136|nr:hypothetical protein [Halomicronema sp. CCY15110]